jgi:hypothetical protein
MVREVASKTSDIAGDVFSTTTAPSTSGLSTNLSHGLLAGAAHNGDSKLLIALERELLQCDRGPKERKADEAPRRQVSRPRERARASESHIRTPEQLKAAREPSRPGGVRENPAHIVMAPHGKQRSKAHSHRALGLFANCCRYYKSIDFGNVLAMPTIQLKRHASFWNDCMPLHAGGDNHL